MGAEGSHHEKQPPGRCFPARCGAARGGYGAAWAAWSAPSRCPRTVSAGNRAIRVFTRPETRDTVLAGRAAQASANSQVFTKHETRDTKHGLFSKHGFYRRAVRRGCETFAQPTAATRTAAPVTQSLFSMFTSVRHCSLLFYYCSLKNISRSQCSITVRRFRSASRRAPFAAAPVSLRVAFAAAIAKWTHAEKRRCTGSHRRGKLSLLR